MGDDTATSGVSAVGDPKTGISDTEVIDGIVRRHTLWVTENKERWRSYRAALADDFWTDPVHRRLMFGETLRGNRSRETLWIQSNQVKPWLVAYEASLFYKAPRASVRADDVVLDGEEDDPADAAPIAAIIDRWLGTVAVRRIATRAIRLGMMYGEAAFKLSSDLDKTSALNAVVFDVVPPWEIVHDRLARSAETQRYRGHRYWDSVENVARKFGIKDRSQLTGKAKPDTLYDTITPSGSTVSSSQVTATADASMYRNEQAFVELLEFYDYTGVYVAKDGTEIPGEFRIYVLNGANNQPCIYRGAIPYTDGQGRPVAPLIPVIFSCMPEYPMWGIPPVASVYENNKELNFVLTWLAQAWRKEAARKGLYHKGAISEEMLAKLMSPEDMELAEVEDSNVQLDNVVKWLDMPDLSKALMEYRAALAEQKEKTDSQSPQSRGEPIKYVSASQTAQMDSYNQTAVGEFKSILDNSLAEAAALYLRVLCAAHQDHAEDKDKVPGPIRVRIAGKILQIVESDLLHRWQISLADAASTPIGEAQARAAFNEVLPKLLQLVPIAAGTDSQYSPTAVALARESIDRLVALYELPQEFSWPNLVATATKIPAPPPPTPVPPTSSAQSGAGAGGGAPIPPQIAAAAQAGQGGAP